MTNSLIGDVTKSRIFAAGVDTLLAMFLALFTASRLPGLPDADRLSVAVTAYLLYFLIQEAIWPNTLGKRMFGLCIRRLNGTRCGWGAAFVRTATRVVEANPGLIGGLPAALLGAFSKRHQRLGDWLSGCVVVRATAMSSELGAVQQGVEADEAEHNGASQLNSGVGGHEARAMGTHGILNGSNDYAVLSSLYGVLGQPQNPSQELFVRAWELTGFLASDGFEWLFEQNYGVEELAAMLANVGFQEGATFIRRAYSMVPETLLEAGQEKLLLEHLRSNCEPFKALLHEYFRVADNRLLPVLGNFVRQNQQDFEGVLA